VEILLACTATRLPPTPVVNGSERRRRRRRRGREASVHLCTTRNIQSSSHTFAGTGHSGLPFMMGEYTAIPFHLLTAFESTQPPPLKTTSSQ